ncbi:MAG: hypothetical protein V8Q54_08190 [Alistipes senegalensis]
MGYSSSRIGVEVNDGSVGKFHIVIHAARHDQRMQGGSRRDDRSFRGRSRRFGAFG